MAISRLPISRSIFSRGNSRNRLTKIAHYDYRRLGAVEALERCVGFGLRAERRTGKKRRGFARASGARMVGCDASDADVSTWLQLAQWFAEAQTRAIVDGAMLVMSACAARPEVIVAAGIGAPVIAEAARHLQCACTRFDELVDVAPEARFAVCHCAPAAALAWLAS